MSSETATTIIRDPKEFQNLIRLWLQRYGEKPESMADEEWLSQELSEKLPEISQEEHQEFSHLLLKNINSISAANASVKKAEERGMDKNEWLYRELQNSSSGLKVHEFGEYLTGIDKTIEQCNREWEKVFITTSGELNQNPQLHGYIFEQDQANSFNMDAALGNRDIRAEVLRPEPGQTYGKNSADIRVTSGEQYQAKAGKTQEASEQYFQNGDYEGQTPLVPEGQGKDGVLVERIEAGGAKSKASDYDKLKEKQQNAQKDGKIPENSWNDYTNRELSFNIGKQAVASATFAAAASSLYSVAEQLWENGEVDIEPVAQAALTSGAKTGATTAISGAMKVAIEKGVISLPWGKASDMLVSAVTSKPIPIPIAQATFISGVASAAIETICLGYKVANGDMEPDEALRELECNVYATVACLESTAIGAAKGVAFGAVFGPVGIAIGGFVGGTVGYLAGSTCGRYVAKGVQKIRAVAGNVIKGVWEGAKKVGSAVKDKVSGAIDWFASFF